MNARQRTLLVGLLAASWLAAVGCGLVPPSPLSFNNRMARGNDRLAKAGKEFYKTIAPLAEGKPANAQAVRRAYQKMEDEVKDLQKTWKRMKPPPNSTTAPEMLKKYQEFLEGQQTILDKYASKIVAVVEDGKTPDPNAKWQAIVPLLDSIDAEERKTRGALGSAQTEYAKAHRYKLELPGGKK